MEEIPELFNYGDIRKEHVEWLYRPDRPYKIIETTHTSLFDVKQKRYFPDKFMFVSKYSQQQYSEFSVPSCVVEYPNEKLEKNKSQCIKKLNFDNEYFNVLNVGLFNKNKNQGYVFDIAKKLKDYKINFHFVGNLADNFSDYWRPLMSDKSDNCFIYGERDDSELFYQASDLVIHSSTLELNPLVIKEATSYDLPVLLNKLDTYLDMYDSYKNIKYLTMNVDQDSQYILDNFNIKRKDDDKTFQKNLIDEYKNTLSIKSNNVNVKIENESSDDTFNYNINFIDGARVEILGNKKIDFDVEIFDKNTNDLIYKTTIPTNNWCATNTKFYREYKIDIKHNNQLLISHIFNLENKNVLIQLDSKSIGDTLAWFPYVEEFRKKHNCNVYCITFWNNWFIDQYPEINFLEPGSGDSVVDLYARYCIGWYMPFDFMKNPNDYKKIPLQKTSSDILGLEYKEIIPKIEIPEGVRPIEEKYVCIAQYSTANTKHWHYPCKNSDKGWQMIVDWLNEQGYKVMVISKQETKLKNIIDRTGNFPIEHRINELKWCEFFIGIGSGLSWLAWAVGKKVVMISGFSNPICEFKTNIINVHNFNVCNGCFNRYAFDRGDWNWCPDHKDTDRQFECSINITPKMVVDRIVNSKLVENPKYFDFDKYDEIITLDEKDINIIYEEETNRLTISYNNDIPTPKINIDIKDFYKNKVYHVVSDISLDRNYTIWCVPTDKLNQTDKLIISFYEKSKILDMQFNI
jgi:autotransporter strand-loop-strand O-heptosyltransferase